MQVERINPELLLKAAQMARPERGWLIVGLFGKQYVVDDLTGDLEFNPITSDADAFALERALKHKSNGWWSFSQLIEGEYQAISAGYDIILRDPSDTLLLLKAVSAQCAIPLYLEKT